MPEIFLKNIDIEAKNIKTPELIKISRDAV